MSGTVISCPAPYAEGGLGRHLAELLAEAKATGQPFQYFATGALRDDAAGSVVTVGWLPWALSCPPVRFSPGWKSFLGGWAFDAAVARRLPPGRSLTGFDGASLGSFRRARAIGYHELHLESAMSHAENVARQVAKAYAAHPIEPTGFLRQALRRCRAEYAEADFIWVTSEYSRRTHLDAGIPAAKLRKRTLTVPDRFRPPASWPDDGVYRVVFIGSLSLRKGVPVLLDAFHKLPGRAELTLVGGSGTRGMRRYLEAACQRDARVRIAPGDPLPHLHRADVCVHPAYEDGFAYAPMEALACGVTVVVSEDTGMKEHVREGVNGYVVPTGNATAIFERLDHLRRHPLRPVVTHNTRIL